MQASVFATALILIGLLGALFAWVVLRSASAIEPSVDKEALESKRISLIWAFVVVGFVASYVSLHPWPHDASSSEGAVIVNVVGSQWNWEISKKEIPVSTSIIFNVTSRDVNHGFGVYDPKGVLLFQTQAMPGLVNRVKYTFSQLGTHSVLCMEYCGVAHHEMKDELKVVER